MAGEDKTQVKQSPKQPPKAAPKPRGKHAEKASVKPNLPVEELLQDFLRQQLAPNSNDGNSYYVGQVVKVINKEDPNLYLYDIFEDSLVNLERFTNDTNKKERGNTVKILVHIPELFSIGDEIIKPGNKNFLDELHYSTAFKILYTGNENIEVGNYVKVIFKNNQSFKEPEITAIYRADSSSNVVTETRNKIKSAFKADLDCRVDQLSSSGLNSANVNLAILQTPVLGYYQFFNNLELLLSDSGKESFLRNYLDQTQQANADLGSLQVIVTCSKKIESTVGNNKIVKEKIKTLETEDYIIFLDLLHPKNDILSKYVSYIEKNLTALQFSFKSSEFSQEGKECIIEVDILAFSLQKGETPNLDTYLKNSESLKNNGILVLADQDIPVPQQSPGTITVNTTPDNCENKIPENVELYLKPDQKYQKFIDRFLLGKTNSLPYNYGFEITNSEQLLNPEALRISGEKILKKEKDSFYTFADLLKINKKFYSTPERVLKKISADPSILLPDINSNYDDSKKNFVTNFALESRLIKISKFLKRLRNQIQRIEKVPLDSVLIVPINVLRAKQKSGKEYEFSRHYFGLAVDFVVFVKFSDTNIKQIPPEIVYLYCRKITSSEKYNTGNGIYFDNNYNHFEYLIDVSGEEDLKNAFNKLTADERANGRIWVNKKELTGDLKDINKQSSQKIEQILVNYVMKTKSSFITGLTLNKIMELV